MLSRSEANFLSASSKASSLRPDTPFFPSLRPETPFLPPVIVMLLLLLAAALTGRAQSPGIFDVLVLLGREESLSRIRDRAAQGVTA